MSHTLVPVRQVLVWQSLLLLVLLVLPMAILGHVSGLPKRELFLYALLYAGYAASAAVHLLYVRHLRGWHSLLMSGLITTACFALPLLAIVLMRAPVSRMLVLDVFVLALLLLPLSLLRGAAGIARSVIMALLFVGVGALITRQQSVAVANTGKFTTSTTFASSLYPLEIKTYVGYVPRPAVRGGGLAQLGDDVLLGAGDGTLYRLNLTDDLVATKLNLRVPINGEEFATAIGAQYADPEVTGVKSEEVKVQAWRFRVADVLARRQGERVELFASHHYWHQNRQCYVVRVSTIELPWPLPETLSHSWHTLYETTPCLPLQGKMIDTNPNAQKFSGEFSGGRLALLDARTLLLTVGDHGISGLTSDYIPSQDPAASYGKIIAIDLESERAQVHSLGHRNPQGLYVDDEGTVWETEHAVRGGDELNVIEPNTNYGWPQVTYGTQYTEFVWPLNEHQGHHDGYRKPIYAWVPSIGISNLIGVTHDRFAAWRGDLLVSSLVGSSIFRVKVEEQRVILAEPIPVGQRVRDLLELPDGRILIWADGGALMSITSTTQIGPKLAFGLNCGGCHTANNGKIQHAGPDLLGVLGRDIASTSFAAYSPALLGKSGSWTRESLDQFLRDPQAFAPGTTMMFPGISDVSKRRQLIDYLTSTSPSP